MRLKYIYIIFLNLVLNFNKPWIFEEYKSSVFCTKSIYDYYSNEILSQTIPILALSNYKKKDPKESIYIRVSSNAKICNMGSVIVLNSVEILNATKALQSVSMQITTNYKINHESLFMASNVPGITSSWNNTTGKLVLTGAVSATVFESALLKVTYKTLSPINENKDISVNLSDANYLPLTGHFYEFVDKKGISWKKAKKAASKRKYYGLKGYLATITSREEANFAGKQITGAGWLGGSDKDKEGIWKWMTGPEKGTIFWKGRANGSSPNYAFWNKGEPNNVGRKGEDYVHITHDGIGVKASWNDLPDKGGSGVYQPTGYIVEYGGLKNEDPLSIASSVTILFANKPKPKGIFF